jgi:hypothetical protein
MCTTALLFALVPTAKALGVTVASAGLPDDFHEAAAEVYERRVALKDNADASIDDVVRFVLRENRDRPETREALR